MNKLNKISKGKSDWLEKAKERQKNKDWLKNSQKIALKVLQTLCDKKMSKKELAEAINVSPQQVNKIVKGNENMTLETITKLENALDIKLLFSKQSSVIETKYVVKKEYVYTLHLTKKTKAFQKANPYEIGMEYNLNMVSEKYIGYAKA